MFAHSGEQQPVKGDDAANPGTCMAFSCLASLVVDVVAVVESPLLEALLCLYDKSGILKPSEVPLCFHLLEITNSQCRNFLPL